MKPRIGDTITQQARGTEHRYTLARTFEHTNSRGRIATVLVWQGQCQTCGATFEATSSKAPRYLNRNCPQHAKVRPPQVWPPDHVWPPLQQPFTNQMIDAVLRNMTDQELDAVIARSSEKTPNDG